jgi:hypothetical protein
MNVVLGLLPLYRTRRIEQLALYREVRAFVSGVMRHIGEQREKAQREKST